MIKMIYTGMKRRKHETRYVSLVTFVAVLFMTGITLFQSIMNEYVFSTNLYNYGDWVISSVNNKCEHPYLLTESSVTTGMSIVDEEGLSLDIYAGKTDANFPAMYEELLYEGRMPEKDNEIAMDISSLAILGYSYQLGQVVELSYLDESGAMHSKSYELVGTLKNFSSIWKRHTLYPLPSFIVTEAAFETYKPYESYDWKAFTTYFYQLNPQYSDINTYEFAESLMPKPEDAASIPVTYNEYVYENRIWGSAEMFDNVTRAIMLIAAVGIGYLLLAYTSKRREVYYRYRCIGASKIQMRGIVLFECFSITIPQIALGMISAYAGAFAGCKLVEKNQVFVDYTLDGGLLGEQIVLSLAVVVLAVLAAQLSISDKRLAGNTGQVKPAKYNMLRKIAGKIKHPEKSLFLRQDMLHPMQQWVSGVFTVLACGCLILCMFKIYNQFYLSNRVLEQNDDFQMSYEDVEEYYFEAGSTETVLYKQTYKPADLSQGVDEQFLEEIILSPGVKSLETYWTDEVHIFQWEGMEDSQMMQGIIDSQMFDTPLEYKMKMVFYEDVDALREALEKEQSNFQGEELDALLTNQNFDWEAIENGESVILRTTDDATICTGDVLDILHFEEGYNTSVKVEAVLNRAFSNYNYYILGTRALAEKMIANENKTLRYNNINIMYDSNSSYESTDKQLAAMAINNGFIYQSDAEARRMAVNELIQSIGIYGALFVVIFIVYVTLQKSFLMNRLKYMQEKYLLLKRIGMEDKQYTGYAVVSEIIKHLWIVLGLGFGYFLIFCDRYVFNQVSGTAEEYILDAAIGEVIFLEDQWFFLFAGILYLFMVGISVRSIRKFVGGEKR